MKNFNRGVLYLKRNIGSSILLLVVMVLAGSIIYGMYAAKTGLDLINKQSNDGAATKVSVEPFVDEKDMMEMDYNDYPELTKEQRDIIAANQYVTSVNEQAYGGLAVIGDYESYEPDVIPYEETEDGQNYVMYQSSLYMQGTNELAAPYEAESYIYDYQFTDQQIASGENVIVLNDEFMKVNNLNIGDTVTIGADPMMFTDNQGMPLEGLDTITGVEYEIVGTYTFAPSETLIKRVTAESADWGGNPNEQISYYYAEAYIPTNSMINTSAEILTQLDEELDINEETLAGTNSEYAIDSLNPHLSYVYTLTSQSDLDAFTEEIQEAIPDTELEVYPITEYDPTLQSLETIVGLSTALMIIFGIIMVIILSLIITVSIRSRRKEIGILISLGEKKIKIYLQLVTELVLMMAISIAIAIPVGYFTINALMKVNIYNAFSAFTGAYSSGFVPPEQNLPFSILSIFVYIGISIVIVLLSTAIPTLYLLNLKPKKILL